MTGMDLEIVDLTEFVGDIEIPCDFAGEPECHDEPARWVMHRQRCCPNVPAAALACEECKESRLMNRFALQCQWCGHIWMHAPDAYTFIEPLERQS